MEGVEILEKLTYHWLAAQGLWSRELDASISTPFARLSLMTMDLGYNY
jgi:hypothetical protein